MAKTTADSKAKFQPYHDEFDSLRKGLKKMAWAKDWNFKAEMFGEPRIRGASIRMWKKRRPEEIHFESWIGNADIERGSATLAFHLETPLGDFGVRRNEFNRLLIERGAEMMGDWKGFTLSPRSYQTIKRHVRFEQGKIAEALTPEFSRLQRLGEPIDQALNL